MTHRTTLSLRAATQAAVLSGRKLSRLLARDGLEDAAEWLDGLLDGAVDGATPGPDALPTHAPHGGGPDELYRQGRELGYLLGAMLSHPSRCGCVGVAKAPPGAA